MTTTLYDSDDAAAIPADAPAVAGYVDGPGANFAQLAADHGGKPCISITRHSPPTPGARVADVESGTMTAAEGAVWAKDEIADGRRPTLYYSRANAQTIDAALKGVGVAIAAVDFWVADWNAVPHLIPGTVATQYASPTVPVEGQGHYDLSEAEESWLTPTAPEPTPEPEPTPAPEPTGEFMPPTLQTGDLSPAVRSAQSLLNLHNAQLAVDGDFGPRTEEAVRNFQTVMHLDVDGIVGPQTWTALDTFG